MEVLEKVSQRERHLHYWRMALVALCALGIALTIPVTANTIRHLWQDILMYNSLDMLVDIRLLV